MNKVIYLLNLDHYLPEVTALTYPLIYRYAKKIDAHVHLITERKFPKWPLDYEKLQIFELSREFGADWNIYIDSDMAIHPDFFDITAHLHKDTVCHPGPDVASVRWRIDDYFRRDGRLIGTGSCFVVCSDWCLDLWRPLDDLTCEEALGNIFPLLIERKIPSDATHYITDYTLSRNIARFGLKFKTVRQVMGEKELQNNNWTWHHHLMSPTEKLRRLTVLLEAWGV